MRGGPWIAALAVVLSAPACSFFQVSPPENLLVIAVDGLRPDALRPSLGAPRTPHIQRLSGSGVTFSWCFTHTGATLPAHATLLSGRSPASTRVRIDGQTVEPEVPLLQERLRQAGWQTYAVLASGDVRPRVANTGIDRGFHVCRASPADPWSASEVNAQAVGMLERASPDAPWFAYVEYADPTGPYAAQGTADHKAQILLDGRPLDHVGTSDPAPWKRTLRVGAGRHTLEFQSGEELVVRRLEITAGRDAVDVSFLKGALGAPARAATAVFTLDGPGEEEIEISGFVHDAPDLQATRDRYKLAVESVDRAIGQLLACLERNGQYDRTTIVVVAPHGESLGEHGEVGHGASLYDEVLRVPLVVKPALNEAKRAKLGKRRLEVVRLMDVAPTLLELLGEDPLPGAEGLSLLRDAPRLLVAEVHPPRASSTLVAMRDDRYKLVYRAGEDRFEMFDVRSDTLELENVFALQGHFRQQWQAQLRDLAERTPLSANQRVGQASAQKPRR